MWSLRILAATLALASTNVFAQLVNPITRPTVGDTLVAGTTFDILWTVTTPGKLVSLILRKGPSNNIGIVGTIADSIQNTGEYLWAIPTNLVPGTDYAVEIIVGPASNASNVGPDDYNFTPLLTLVNNSTSLGSNSTVTSSKSSSILTSNATVTKASSTGGTPAVTAPATTGTEEATVAATGSAPSNTATATHASSATRFDAMMGGHGFFALIVALAVGIVASY